MLFILLPKQKTRVVLNDAESQNAFVKRRKCKGTALQRPSAKTLPCTQLITSPLELREYEFLLIHRRNVVEKVF